ncbi:3',5'-nucleoside bisphosphate phosphatase [Sulfuritalea sp.]|uniref:3',5'-nucleoside bisphosphate phosphatase n=1 Tax=Sulfuritalea sp. TaxID=2480090 RepID=UPI001AD3EC41|nr:3',5'-nucleoside bisphosphate phosphatase [Sulfuritalea sp.]MBN8474199.1 PHP domain-containing protein [Sulfuritalea sp.]
MKPLNADLHCHSTVSDGLLAPADLIRRADANGVELLALTDHDELGGLVEARAAADEVGLGFVDGVEVSISWGDDQTVHIVGLGIDPTNPALGEGLRQIRSGRDARAGLMAEELDKVGIHGAYEGALRYAGNPALVSRSHFARFIVEQGHAKDTKSVFDYWLAKGKPGYVSHTWATIEDALNWIVGAGGIAVIAHPGRYRLSRTERRELFGAFKDLGGRGIEVLSGSQKDEEVSEFARIAREFGFLASRASDFHGPGESWIDLGRLPDLPDNLVPVWSQL